MGEDGWRWNFSSWRILAIPRWLLRAWPVWVPAVLAVVHYVALSVWGTTEVEAKQIHKVFAAALPACGVLAIVASINSSLKQYGLGSLVAQLWAYLWACPLVEKLQGLRGAAVAVSESGDVVLVTGRAGRPDTLEELARLLQNEVARLERQMADEAAALRTELREVERTAHAIAAEVRQEIERVDQREVLTVKDGLPQQVFGVLLVLHGAVASYLG